MKIKTRVPSEVRLAQFRGCPEGHVMKIKTRVPSEVCLASFRGCLERHVLKIFQGVS